MKTLLKLAFTALFFWALAAPALAAPPPANLSIFSERGQYFSVLLDGRPLTRIATQQVRVGWLAPGRHYADISLATPYGPPMNFRTVLWLQPGRESEYLLVMRRWGPQLEPVAAAPGGPSYGAGGYYGNSQGGYYGTPAPTGPGGGYNSGSYSPDPNSGYDPDSYPAPASPSGGYNPGGYPAPGLPGGGYSPSGTPASPTGGYASPTNPNGSYPTPAYPGNNGGNGYNGGGNGCYAGSAGTVLRLLAPAELTSLTQAIRRASFDSEKLSIAKQGLSQSSVRAAELAALVKNLSFSDARVDLATFGYAHVSDPQNFYLVYSSLEFSADVQKVRQNLNLP